MNEEKKKKTTTFNPHSNVGIYLKYMRNMFFSINSFEDQRKRHHRIMFGQKFHRFSTNLRANSPRSKHNCPSMNFFDIDFLQQYPEIQRLCKSHPQFNSCRDVLSFAFSSASSWPSLEESSSRLSSSPSHATNLDRSSIASQSLKLSNVESMINNAEKTH